MIHHGVKDKLHIFTFAGLKEAAQREDVEHLVDAKVVHLVLQEVPLVAEGHLRHILDLYGHFLGSLTKDGAEVKLLGFESKVWEAELAYKLNIVPVGVIQMNYLQFSVIQPRDTVSFHARVKVYSNIRIFAWLEAEIFLVDTKRR